jgi:hypothetical protein
VVGEGVTNFYGHWTSANKLGSGELATYGQNAVGYTADGGSTYPLWFDATGLYTQTAASTSITFKTEARGATGNGLLISANRTKKGALSGFTATAANDILLTIEANGSSSTAYVAAGDIEFIQTAAASTYCPTKMILTTHSATKTHQFRFMDDASLFIATTDVAHGLSNPGTDVFAAFRAYSATEGGADFQGYRDNDAPAAGFTGSTPTEDSTRSAAGKGYVHLRGFKISSGALAVPTANYNLVCITKGSLSSPYYTTVAIFDTDGDLHLDGSSSNTVWDDHDDVALLTGLRASLMPERSELRQRFADWMVYAREPLERSGVVTFNANGHHFISLKGMHMLEIDAMRQLYERINTLESRLHEAGVIA